MVSRSRSRCRGEREKKMTKKKEATSSLRFYLSLARSLEARRVNSSPSFLTLARARSAQQLAQWGVGGNKKKKKIKTKKQKKKKIKKKAPPPSNPHPAPEGPASKQRKHREHLRQSASLLRQHDARPDGHDPRLPLPGGPRGLGLPLDAELGQEVPSRGRRLGERRRFGSAVEPDGARGDQNGGSLLRIENGICDCPGSIEPGAPDLCLQSRGPASGDRFPGEVDDAAHGAVDGFGPVFLAVKCEFGDPGELVGRGNRVAGEDSDSDPAGGEAADEPVWLFCEGGGSRCRGAEVETRKTTKKKKSRAIEEKNQFTNLTPTVPVAPVIATSPLIPEVEEAAAATAAIEVAATGLAEAAGGCEEEGEAGFVNRRRSTTPAAAFVFPFDLGPASALAGCILPRSDAVAVESILVFFREMKRRDFQRHCCARIVCPRKTADNKKRAKKNENQPPLR